MENSQPTLIQFKKLVEEFEAEFRQKTKDPDSGAEQSREETKLFSRKDSSKLVCVGSQRRHNFC